MGAGETEMAFTMPADFIWGSATAAHQIEGGNWNSDWWAWEHAPDTPCREPSGDACDFLHHYEADLALLARLGQKAFRFSVEWARVEPEEGEFSGAALGFYRRLGAQALDDWTVHRLSGDALRRLATDGAAIPG